jgi:excisionase family DNA binding protein
VFQKISLNPSSPSEAPKLEPLWSVSKVASYLNRKPSTVYQWVEQGRIPYFRIYKRKGLRFRKSLINQWLKERAKKPEMNKEEKIEQKILEAIEKTPLNLDQILRDIIAEVKRIRYTSCQEKPGKDKGLGKEGNDGNV